MFARAGEAPAGEGGGGEGFQRDENAVFEEGDGWLVGCGEDAVFTGGRSVMFPPHPFHC